MTSKENKLKRIDAYELGKYDAFEEIRIEIQKLRLKYYPKENFMNDMILRKVLQFLDYDKTLRSR